MIVTLTIIFWLHNFILFSNVIFYNRGMKNEKPEVAKVAIS